MPINMNPKYKYIGAKTAKSESPFSSYIQLSQTTSMNTYVNDDKSCE